MADIVQALRDWQDCEPAKTFGGEILNDVSKAADTIEGLRNTLMWTFDRLSICGSNEDRLTQREQLRTMQEIGKVLRGLPSRAARYTPEATDESSKIVMAPATTGRPT